MLLSSVILLQVPAVQTFLANRAANRISEKLSVNLTIGKLNFLPVSAVVIHDALVLDEEPYEFGCFEKQDTIFYASRIYARFSLRSLLEKSTVCLKKISVEEGVMALTIEPEKFNNFKRVFPPKGYISPMYEMPDIIRADVVSVKDFRYKMISHLGISHKYPGHGINWYDLDTRSNLTVRNFKIEGGHISGSVERGTVREKSGYMMTDFYGDVDVFYQNAVVTNFRYRDGMSDFNIPYFSMNYDNHRSFTTFFDDVRMKLSMSESTVDMRSIAYFGAGMPEMNIRFRIKSIEAEGPLRSLNIHTCEFSEKSGVRGRVSGKLYGLPYMSDFGLNADIRNLQFTTEGLSSFINGLIPAKANLDLSKFATGETLTLNGKGNGLFNNLKINGNINSEIGEIGFSGTLKGVLSPKSGTSVSGSVSTLNLDAGKVLGMNWLGKLTATTSANVNLANKISAKIDSLHISRLGFLGYDYSDIDIDGRYDDGYAIARIDSRDKNLELRVEAECQLPENVTDGWYTLNMRVDNADLNATNIDKRGPSKASFTLNSSVSRIDREGLCGKMNIHSLNLENESGKKDIGNITITANDDGGEHSLNLYSDFADASYRGSRLIFNMIGTAWKQLLDESAPSVLKDTVSDWDNDCCRFKLVTKDSRDVLSFALPGFYIAKGTTLNGDIDNIGKASINLTSQRIAYDKNYLKDAAVTVCKDQELVAQIEGGELNLGTIKIFNNSLGLSARKDSISLKYEYDNKTSSETYGRLGLEAGLSRVDKFGIKGKFRQSLIVADGQRWRIKPFEFNIDNNGFEVNGAEIGNKGQSVVIDGGYSTAQEDTLYLAMKDFNLETLTSLFLPGADFRGKANGKVMMTSPSDESFSLMMNFSSDSTFIGGHTAGNLKIGGNWDAAEKKIKIAARTDIGKKCPINLRAEYAPQSKYLKARMLLDEMDLGYAEAFVKDVFSEMKGGISGVLRAEGPVDSLHLSSSHGELNDAHLRVAYTGAAYNANGFYSVDDNGVTLRDVIISDGNGGQGAITGGIDFDHLKNIRMDMHANFKNLNAFDNPDNTENDVYGRVSATGKIDMTGPFNALNMTVNAHTDGYGDIHIPLTGALTSSSTDLLTFKSAAGDTVWIDPYDEMLSEIVESKQSKSNLGMNLNLDVAPEVNCHLVIDKSNGNALTGNGSGNIRMNIQNDLFNIKGDYNLMRGNFHFGVLGIVNKDFDIQNGSSIKFNGDIMESDLDINASYLTKASLSNLITDTTMVSNRRNVACGLHIYDKLKNPQVKFSIDVPDLEPTIKSQVLSALNTDDKIQKQFLALLITNNFIPDTRSGIENNTNVLYSNVAEIMAGQVNNIFQKLEIPLDLGLSYQPNEGGTDIFDVALSTQLFNDRVLVNGALGNRQYVGNSDDVVGDLDIEVKLDKSGAVRATLFTHSADQYSNYLDYSQRNGIGIGYQNEFRNIREFIRSLFRRKKGNLEDLAGTEDNGTVTISIEEQ